MDGNQLFPLSTDIELRPARSSPASLRRMLSPAYIRSALRATKRFAAPHAASDQLERTGGDCLSSASDADDGTPTPATVTASQPVGSGTNIGGHMYASKLVVTAPGR